MKIYNKRGFLNGLLFCGCGIFNLIMLAVGYFQTCLWFWYVDAAVFFLIGGILLFRAVSQEKARRDLTGNWRLGKTVIYNKYGFLDGIWLLLCGTSSLVTARSTGSAQQYFFTALFFFFGLNRAVRAVSLEDAKKDITEERDERNKLVTLKAQGMSFQITQTASLLLMCFLVLKGGRFNQLDLASAGFGAAVCFFISILSGFFTQKYYDKHI